VFFTDDDENLEPGFDTGREITPAAAYKSDKKWLTTTLCSSKACRFGARCWAPNT
jgi:hypothetical protein